MINICSYRLRTLSGQIQSIWIVQNARIWLADDQNLNKFHWLILRFWLLIAWKYLTQFEYFNFFRWGFSIYIHIWIHQKVIAEIGRNERFWFVKIWNVQNQTKNRTFSTKSFLYLCAEFDAKCLIWNFDNQTKLYLKKNCTNMESKSKFVAAKLNRLLCNRLLSC